MHNKEAVPVQVSTYFNSKTTEHIFDEITILNFT
jgi:hypothetical protein